MGKKKRSVATDVINTLISAGINWERELNVLRREKETLLRNTDQRVEYQRQKFVLKAKQARDLVDLVREAERQTGFSWPLIGGAGDFESRLDAACKALNLLAEVELKEGGTIKVYSGEKPEVR